MTLTADEVGHAFPTGDLFRRLTVAAEVVGEDHAVLARAEQHLARHFGATRVGLAVLRTQVRDDRVTRERAVNLELGPEAAGEPLHFAVTYERVEQPISPDGEEALVEGSITVAQGEVGEAMP